MSWNPLGPIEGAIRPLRGVMSDATPRREIPDRPEPSIMLERSPATRRSMRAEPLERLVLREPPHERVDADSVRRALAPGWVPEFELFAGAVSRAGIEASNVLARVFNALRGGDPESALEILSTLQSLVDPKAAGGGAKDAQESREGVKEGLEFQTEEANAALEKMEEARRAYREALARLEAMQRRAVAEREAMLEELGVAQGSAVDRLEETKRVMLEDVAALAQDGQRFYDRKRELSKLTEPMPVSDEMEAHAEEMAARFAADAESVGYLTRQQAGALAAALLAVPTVSEQPFKSANVQVAPALVDAAIRGFQKAVGDAKAVELMSAQLARAAFSGANSTMKDTTLPGWGRDALRSHLRDEDALAVDFSARPDAAAATPEDAMTRGKVGEAYLWKQGPARESYEPGDLLKTTVRVEALELPLELIGHARFVGYPADAQTREWHNTKWRYTFSEGPNGEIEVERMERTQPRFGVPYRDWSEPEKLPSIARNPDGSFDVTVEARPPDTIEHRSQTFSLDLGGVRTVFTNRVSDA